MTILDATQLQGLIDEGEAALAEFLSAAASSCRHLARRGVVHAVALDEMRGPLEAVEDASRALQAAGLIEDATSLWSRAHWGLDRAVMMAALDPWGPAERH
jgi:hypothetical protein